LERVQCLDDRQRPVFLSLNARRRKVDVLRRAFADRPDKPPAFLPEVHTWGDWRDRLSELEGIIDVLYLDEERDCWVVLDYKSAAAAEGVLAMKYAPQLLAYAWAAAQILPGVRSGARLLAAELLVTGRGVRVPALPPLSAEGLDTRLRARLQA
jgi:hypothetical protein